MKQVPIIDLHTAAKMVKEGDILLQGGFGMTGNPVHLMHALAEIGTKELTFIGNNTGEAGIGGGRLLRNGQLKKMIGSFFTSNPMNYCHRELLPKPSEPEVRELEVFTHQLQPGL
jgi:3-oxoacid CoA-transferase